MIRECLRRLDLRFSQIIRDGAAGGRQEPILSLLAHSGDSVIVLPALGLLWWRDGLVFSGFYFEGIAGVLLSMACVALVKLVFRRARPVGDWGSLCRKTDPHSFPSGHAARTMALAIAVTISAGPVWGVPLLAWATLVGVSRVALGMHWFFDVLVGWAFGLIAALGVAVLWR